MHILYVDESGDDGFNENGVYPINSTPTCCFVRAGIALHDEKWHKINRKIDDFRNKLKIPAGIELHATEIQSGRDRIYRGKKAVYVKNWFGKNFPQRKDRRSIILGICDLIGALVLSIFYIIINKTKIRTTVSKYKSLPKLRSWEFLIERYNLYLNNEMDSRGIIV